MVCYFNLRILGIFLFVSTAFGDNLVATRVQTKLPVPLYLMAPYYDQESDYIYLLGGTNGSISFSSILRFNIITETIEEIANLPKASISSPLEDDDAGNLIYFDSDNPPYEIYKYDPVNNSVKTVGELCVSPSNSASVRNSAGNVFLVGGTLGRGIMEININSEPLQGNVVGQLPSSLGTTAAVKVTNNTALVFGAGGRFQYLELDLTTLDTDEVAHSSFPGFQNGMKLTSDSNFVYLFGGELTGSGVPADAIIQLDPTNHNWEFLQVQDFPVIPDYYFYFAPEVIWVEKLNRIYMFGGGLRKKDTFEYLFLDDIHYIDLTPLSYTSTPPTMTTTEEPASTTLDPLLFSCDGRTDGTHPHPSDCSKYIACRNGTIEGVYSCLPPLLYDPISGICNLPSLVDCQLSCENKEDGTYAHPHDCRLFIICFNRDILVSWCDALLLFDPQELQCTLPELVQCANKL